MTSLPKNVIIKIMIVFGVLIFTVFILVAVLVWIHLILEKSNKLQADLKEERDLARAIVNCMGEGVLIIDTNYNIRLINPAAEKMLETTAKEAVGQKWAEFVKAYVGDREIAFNERSSVKSLKSGQVKVTSIIDDHYYQTRSGRKFPVVAVTAPFIHEGKVLGVVKVFHDGTKEKEIDRMKTEFISLASHQLRTPLSAIKWFTELLIDRRSGPMTKEQREYANNIAYSTERMIELVNSLLNITRIESGRIIIEPQPTDLIDMIKKIITELQRKMEKKRQKFIISAHEHLPKINIDPRLMRHVYTNLIDNAIKYTPDGGEISIFISRKNGQIISQISDNGYGIPKEEQHKVFDKFFRGYNVIRHVTEGTGLGLYLTKAIIESSGGKIWFKSPALVEKTADGKEVGKGTTFWFSIPAKGVAPKKGEVTLEA